VHMTLKTKRLTRQDFDEFIKLYKAEDQSKRKETWIPDQVRNDGKGDSSSPAKYAGSVGMTKGEVAMTNEGRWRSFTYDELIARDKTNLDIFWFKDESLEDTENLPAPEILAQEIVEQLEAALNEFRSVEEVLGGNNV